MSPSTASRRPASWPARHHSHSVINQIVLDSIVQLRLPNSWPLPNFPVAPAAAATFPTSRCTAPAPAGARPSPGASAGARARPSRFPGSRAPGSGPPGPGPARPRWEGAMAAPQRPRPSAGAPGPGIQKISDAEALRPKSQGEKTHQNGG